MNFYEEKVDAPAANENGYCSQTFIVDGKPIVNNYKCGQQPFTSSDLWKLSSKKRSVVINAGISLN